ncbi:MAG TPA: Fur family transcriptional regulator [Polyangiales bacterium]|nr:Fur family transcriptional regulator [Polyangiales bacterium]
MVSKAKPSSLASDAHAGTIREAGLRVTQPRLAVMQVLERQRGPLSHADLISALDGQGFDRVTLYRNLNDLADAGIVARTEVGDHVWRFELRKQAEAHSGIHPHFTCTDCGTVACLPGDAVQISRSGRVPKAVREQTVEVSLRGVCDRCS